MVALLLVFLALTTPIEARASTPTPLDSFTAITEGDLAMTFGDMMVDHQAVEGIEEINMPVMTQRFSFFDDKEAIWALFEALRQPKLRSVERLVAKQLGPFFNGTELVFNPATHIAFVAALHGYPTSEADIHAALGVEAKPIEGVGGPIGPDGAVTAGPATIPDPAMVAALPVLDPELREALITFANQTSLVSGELQNSEQKSRRPWIIAGITGGAVVVMSAVAALVWWWGKRQKQAKAAMKKELAQTWEGLPAALLAAESTKLKKGTKYGHWSREQQEVRTAARKIAHDAITDACNGRQRHASVKAWLSNILDQVCAQHERPAKPATQDASTNTPTPTPAARRMLLRWLASARKRLENGVTRVPGDNGTTDVFFDACTPTD